MHAKWIWTCYESLYTKISKVPFGLLRSIGHHSVVYVYDSCLQGETYQACPDDISDTDKLLRELDFVIHTEKSLLIPSQTIAFLGFIISPKNMTLSLPDGKKNRKFRKRKNNKFIISKRQF